MHRPKPTSRPVPQPPAGYTAIHATASKNRSAATYHQPSLLMEIDQSRPKPANAQTNPSTAEMALGQAPSCPRNSCSDAKMAVGHL